MKARSSAEAVFARRRAGVLLHPTALPGDYGKLGHAARQFVEFLHQAGMTVWQTLPTGPTHSNLSPYQTLSAHAGNPEFIDLQELCSTGLLLHQELADATRAELLSTVTARFHADQYTPDGCINQDQWEHFLAAHRNWLDDFALFMVRQAWRVAP